ncbi:MAG: sugar ABC transporter substrate-binding protein [Chloroflexota bacterium]
MIVTRDHYVFGFANVDDNNPYALELLHSLEAAADKRDNISLIIRDNGMDSNRAKANIETFMENNVDVIIMFHIDQRASQNLIFPIRLRRTPVLSIDIPIAGTRYFGINNEEVGRLAGQALVRWIAEKWQGQIDHVVCVTEQRVLDFTHQRFEGVIAELERAFDLRPQNDVLYLDNGSSADVTHQRMLELLQRWPEPHLVTICINDSTARGVIRAVRETSRTQDVAIVSYDGTEVAFEAFASKDIQFVTSPHISQRESGDAILDLCIRLAKNEMVNPRTYVPTVPLTWENWREYGQHREGDA